jgi:hypothetical protein
MSADLITTALAIEQLASFDTADTTLLGHMVSACSAFAEKWCRRTFTATSYEELYIGDGDTVLLLNQYPIISVSRVACNLQSVLSVNYGGSAARATVAVAPTGLTMVSVASGVATTSSLLFATYVSITALAAAVNAVSGWVATVQASAYGGLPSSDLLAQQGAFNANNVNAALQVHVSDLDHYRIDAERGVLVRSFGWVRGYSYRVSYRAGFATIPADVQQAVAELVVNTYQARAANSNFQSESLGGYSYSRAIQDGFDVLSIASKKTLNLYRDYRVGRYQERVGVYA